MRVALRLGSFGLVAGAVVWMALGGAAGCTVTLSDPPLDADVGGDTQGDAQEDTAQDTATDARTDAPTDAPVTPGVVIRATDLIDVKGSDTTAPFKDFGGGSTYADIAIGGRLAYAVARYEPAGGTPITSTNIGKDDKDNYVDGRMVNLPTGAEITITVTGYLRGLNGNNADAPSTRVAWATTTCKVTPSATADVVATCGKLQYIAGLSGIVFSSDVLPPGYCEGKGKTDFSLLRARIPYSGAAVVSKTTNDCEGVVWVPESEFKSAEVNGVSEWSLSLEPKSAATACTLKPPGCKVDRKTGDLKIDIYVVGESCRLTNASTGGTCF